MTPNRPIMPPPRQRWAHCGQKVGRFQCSSPTLPPDNDRKNDLGGSEYFNRSSPEGKFRVRGFIERSRGSPGHRAGSLNVAQLSVTCQVLVTRPLCGFIVGGEVPFTASVLLKRCTSRRWTFMKSAVMKMEACK